jgi:phosphoglycolate phosphatase
MSALTVVFDLDGTLVDTAGDLANATNKLLANENLAPIPVAKMRTLISYGARHMIERGFAERGVRKPEAEIDALLANFLIDYGKNIAVESRPFPGTMELLGRLQQAGHRLAVCTNKRERLARKLLAELKMDGFFHAVTGRDTLPVHKPDPGHLIGTVILADGDLGSAVMIGDSDVDIQTAKSAGLPSVGVSFGYSREPMATFKPNVVIDHFDELDDVLAGIYPAPLRKRGSGT